MVASIVFVGLIVVGGAFFGMNVMRIRKNILLGKDLNRSDNKSERWKTMILVALGQKKMFQRPIPALLHLGIYVAFMVTQIELIEIFVDGITGTHRVFMEALGSFYTVLISFIEILSVFALIATFAFLARRNLLKVPRFHMSEMTGWPKLNGNIILYMEFVLVICILSKYCFKSISYK